MRIKSLFTIPEGKKVTEKAFSKVLLSSICSILLCMACLMGTTWAWFRADLENQYNEIQIANVNSSVTVKKSGESDSEAISNGCCTLNKGTYTVSIQVTSDGSRKDDFGLKNVYMTMTVVSGASDASAVSEDSSTPSTAPTVSAAPGIYTFCMEFGEQDSDGYRVATREITLNIPTDGTKVTFTLSWVKPNDDELVDAASDAIGDPPATDPT